MTTRRWRTRSSRSRHAGPLEDRPGVAKRATSRRRGVTSTPARLAAAHICHRWKDISRVLAIGVRSALEQPRTARSTRCRLRVGHHRPWAYVRALQELGHAAGCCARRRAPSQSQRLSRIHRSAGAFLVLPPDAKADLFFRRSYLVRAVRRLERASVRGSSRLRRHTESSRSAGELDEELRVYPRWRRWRPGVTSASRRRSSTPLCRRPAQPDRRARKAPRCRARSARGDGPGLVEARGPRSRCARGCPRRRQAQEAAGGLRRVLSQVSSWRKRSRLLRSSSASCRYRRPACATRAMATDTLASSASQRASRATRRIAHAALYEAVALAREPGAEEPRQQAGGPLRTPRPTSARRRSSRLAPASSASSSRARHWSGWSGHFDAPDSPREVAFRGIAALERAVDYGAVELAARVSIGTGPAASRPPSAEALLLAARKWFRSTSWIDP